MRGVRSPGKVQGAVESSPCFHPAGEREKEAVDLFFLLAVPCSSEQMLLSFQETQTPGAELWSSANAASLRDVVSNPFHEED